MLYNFYLHLVTLLQELSIVMDLKILKVKICLIPV
jgi:hypothetical protein